jgi:hypothetical protein
MGILVKILLTKFLPARLAWVAAAFVLGRALAARREAVPVPSRRPYR